MTIKSVWVCKAHFRELERQLGYDIPVHTIHNTSNSKCYKCDKIASNHITENIDEEIEIPAERLEVLE